MAKTETLHIRIEPNLKLSAEITLKQLGLSTADAINIFLQQVILTGGLPFPVKLLKPNAETIAAIKEAHKISKTGKGFSTVDDLMKELNL
ncbi:MAG: type II toxin-antitoxin system RelB/DinJ family antitoxin [Actinobacteria bacterium]|nr:type II toxin-antitoxin system RelB/DinJ family antitoxin [Actinomycetota bacterium]MBU4483072.1 type II toxin-antitoxin system RelB/DinJ family antitoxin [Actinomycetota bacterium]